MKVQSVPRPELTVTITTCNRVDELCRCVNSFALLAPTKFEVIVFDDGSREPVLPALAASLPESFPAPVEVIRREITGGYISARNELAARARAPYILDIDDDAYILASEGVREALKTLQNDSSLVSIAFPQLDAEGRPHYEQPIDADYPCYCPTFFGYAKLLRRTVFLRVGGYRELTYHEEADLSKRLANIGYHCVFWPDGRVAHVPSANRPGSFSDFRARCQLLHRCYDAIYNEPLPLMFVTIVTTVLYSARRARSMWNLPDDSEVGAWWLFTEMLRTFRPVWLHRQPLRYRVFLRWRWLQRNRPRYVSKSAQSA